MSVYEKLKQQKESGQILSIENLSLDNLKTMALREHIPDSLIADLFNVKKSKITYLRRKNNIVKNSSASLDELLFNQSPSANQRNQEAKEELLQEKNIDKIAKAITHFSFRNGPIEDMHADPDKQLGDTDMMVLNKFAVNRLAYIFQLIVQERWIELYSVVDFQGMYGSNWDDAEPDDGGTRKIIEMMLSEKDLH